MTRDSIRARVEAATPGPWVDGGGEVLDIQFDAIADCYDQTERIGNSQDNAAFIAHARQDIPLLLAVADAAAAVVELLMDEHRSVDAQSALRLADALARLDQQP